MPLTIEQIRDASIDVTLNELYLGREKVLGQGAEGVVTLNKFERTIGGVLRTVRVAMKRIPTTDQVLKQVAENQIDALITLTLPNASDHFVNFIKAFTGMRDVHIVM